MAAALVTDAVTLLILFFGGFSLAAKWAPVAAVIVTTLGVVVSAGRGDGDKDPRASHTARLDQTTEELASEVRKQWLTEARIHRLQDSKPLKVRWKVADSTLADHWENIVHDAEKLTPADFAGQWDDIVEVFTKVPSRRMVVLGGPGAGKSALAIHFTLGMLARRGPGEPVPVIFPVSTWNPDRQSFRGWLAERLAADFGSLGAIASSGRTVASELLSSSRVLPVLDGLDELSEELCGMAVQHLNAELDDTPVMVTCQTETYKKIKFPCHVLTSALPVELLPLTLAESSGYLERTARRRPTNEGDLSGTIWSPVLRHLQDDSHDPGAAALRNVLRTPLMTAMARSVYSDTGHDPAELLKKPLGSAASIEEHLLDAFIPAVYAETARDTEDCGKPTCTVDQAKRWLGFLARHLERRNAVDLAWWELETALPALLRHLAPGLLAGCLTAATVGIVLALFLPYVLVNHWHSGTVVTSGALVAGGVTGLTAGLALFDRHRMAGKSEQKRHDWAFLRYQAAVTLAIAAFLGVTIGAVADLAYGIQLNYLGGYLVQGLLAGAAISVVFGTVGVSDRPVPLTIPWTGRGRTRRRPAAWRIAAVVASFFFGGELSQLTNIGNMEPSYVIPVLAGATCGVAAWFFTQARRLTPPAVAVFRRHPILHRLRHDFGGGLLRCFAVCLFFGLALGTVGGTIAGWRADTNDGFPAGSAVTATSNGTRSAKDQDGWEYSVALDGTKTAKPPNVVSGILIVNPRGSGFIDLPGVGVVEESSADRWAIGPERHGIFGPEQCRYAPFLHCTSFMEHVLIQSKDGRATIRFHDGRAAEGKRLAQSVSEKAVYWFGQLTFRQLLLGGLQFGLIGGLILGGIGGVACGLYRWLETPADLTRSSSPLSSLKTDRAAALARGALVMVLSGLVFFIVALSIPDADGSHDVAKQLWLLMGPVAVCLSAWGRLLVARVWLGITGKLPWRLMAFLSDAHRRGVLRQSGALYQFRHLRLQQRLAADLRSSATPRQPLAGLDPSG
ncbi:MAG: NACHT domain-containing protein [Pseudonocardiaceae bacterium]